MSLTIGVAVPCYKGHISRLKNLFDSIEKQTLKPDKVVISCSSATDEMIPYKAEDYTFPFQIITHPGQKNAASNRNIAASNLGTDIISFFDADDIMHPQRLELIHRCFTQYPEIKIFLHDSEREPPEDSFQMFEEAPFEVGFLFPISWGIAHSVRGENGLTKGHCSVSKEAFDRFKFNETPGFHAREDTFYTSDIVSAYPKQNGYLPFKLSAYFPSHTGGYIEK